MHVCMYECMTTNLTVADNTLMAVSIYHNTWGTRPNRIVASHRSYPIARSPGKAGSD